MTKAIIFIGIVYIGAKAMKRDTYFNTGMEFERGVVYQVDATTANQMARHRGVFAIEGSPQHLAWQEADRMTDAEKAEIAKANDAQNTAPSLADQVEALRIELSMLPRKDKIATHEVAVKLGVEFGADDKMQDMVDAVCAAYQAHLQSKLGV